MFHNQQRIFTTHTYLFDMYLRMNNQYNNNNQYNAILSSPPLHPLSASQSLQCWRHCWDSWPQRTAASTVWSPQWGSSHGWESWSWEQSPQEHTWPCSSSSHTWCVSSRKDSLLSGTEHHPWSQAEDGPKFLEDSSRDSTLSGQPDPWRRRLPPGCWWRRAGSQSRWGPGSPQCLTRLWKIQESSSAVMLDRRSV